MFMNMNDIKKWLNTNGYFLGYDLYNENPILQRKISDKIEQSKKLKSSIIKNYSTGIQKKIPTYDLLIDRINSNIGNMDLEITKGNIPITKIDTILINKYHERNLEIKQSQAFKKQLEDVDYIFTSYKGTYKKYYVIRNKKCIELHGELVDHSKNMLEVDFISRVNNALRDDETNMFKHEYDLMMQKFDNLGIMEKTEQKA